MRKACVVLVSLFIGLGSGFIVPSGVSKTIQEANFTLINVTESNLENVEQIDETELYQNSINKTENVNERSYKIYKKLYKNQLYKSLVPRISIQPVKKSDLRKNIPLKFKEAQKSNVNVQQMFFPNIENKHLHHLPSTYRYDKPGYTLQRQKNYGITETTHFTQNVKTSKPEPTLMPIMPGPYEKYDKLQSKTPEQNKKSDDLENVVEASKLPYAFYQNYVSDFATIAPMKNNMQLKSITRRKPNKQNSCGFLKPNQVHANTYNKKQYTNTGDRFSPIQIDGPNIDPALGNMNEVEDDKLVRFIKDTLAETGILLNDKQRKLNCNNCDEAHTIDDEDDDNEPSLKSKAEQIVKFFEKFKVDDDIVSTTKNSDSIKTNSNTHGFVRGFNINVTNAVLT